MYHPTASDKHACGTVKTAVQSDDTLSVTPGTVDSPHLTYQIPFGYGRILLKEAIASGSYSDTLFIRDKANDSMGQQVIPRSEEYHITHLDLVRKDWRNLDHVPSSEHRIHAPSLDLQTQRDVGIGQLLSQVIEFCALALE
jgi:hypothetical protein